MKASWVVVNPECENGLRGTRGPAEPVTGLPAPLPAVAAIAPPLGAAAPAGAAAPGAALAPAAAVPAAPLTALPLTYTEPRISGLSQNPGAAPMTTWDRLTAWEMVNT